MNEQRPSFEPCYCAKCDGKLPAPCRYGTGSRTSNTLVSELRAMPAKLRGSGVHLGQHIDLLRNAADEIERLQERSIVASDFVTKCVAAVGRDPNVESVNLIELADQVVGCIEQYKHEAARATAEPPAVQSKIAARDVHYRLIEDFGLANDPSANDVVRRLLEGLTSTAPPPSDALITLSMMVGSEKIAESFDSVASYRKFVLQAIRDLQDRGSETKPASLDTVDDDHVCGVCEGTQRGVCNCTAGETLSQRMGAAGFKSLRPPSIPDDTSDETNVTLTCEVCSTTAELPRVGKEKDFVSIIPANGWQLYPRHLCPKCSVSESGSNQ